MQGVIWTIGHGGRTFVEIEHLLAEHGISAVVDVRSRPYSRHAPDFTKAALAELCADAGLGYRWLGETLGGRPDDPRLLLPSGAPDLERLAASPGFLGGVEELIALARTAPTAILCAETDPTGCHRATVIAPALEERGFDVEHILGDGSVIRHQPALPL
jgi:uncharacterized protein (DUF488 family)